MKFKHILFSLLLSSFYPTVEAQDLPLNNDSFSGCQINTLQTFGYGMFVMKGLAAREPVCTGFFLFNQGISDLWPAQQKLWRQCEFDWEFVPFTTSSGREEIIGNQPFPQANLKAYRSEGNSSQPVPGVYTDHLITTFVVKNWNANPKNQPFNLKTTFQELTLATNVDGHVVTDQPPFLFQPQNPPTTHWYFGSQWGFPASLARPSAQDLQHSVAVNLFRMPGGGFSEAVTLNGKKIDFNFTPTAALDYQQNQIVVSSFNKMNMTNQLFCWTKDEAGAYLFDPYTDFHYYTIVWTPNQVAFYVDAGQEGTAIDQAQPIRVFDSKDYPSIQFLGPQFPGATEVWSGSAPDQPVGEVQMNFNIYVQEGWSGNLPPCGIVAHSYLKKMAFYPLSSEALSANKPSVTQADFVTDPQNAGVYLIDFTDSTVWNQQTWRDQFQKYFYANFGVDADLQVTNPNPELATWVPNIQVGNQNFGPGFELKLVSQEQNPPRQFFTLSSGGTRDANGDPLNYTQVRVLEIAPLNEKAPSTPSAIYSAFGVPKAFWTLDPTQAYKATLNVSSIQNPNLQGIATIQLGPQLQWTPIDDPLHVLNPKGGQYDIGVGVVTQVPQAKAQWRSSYQEIAFQLNKMNKRSALPPLK